MQRSTPKHSKLHAAGISLLLILTLILVACGSSNGNSGTNNTNTNVKNNANTPAVPATTPTTAPGVTSGTQPCPAASSAPSYWDPIIPTQFGTSKVERVVCANLIGTSALQALVTVRSTGTGAFLDVYVYDKITDPAPNKLFSLLHLDRGDAKISPYNTVLTAEVDAQSHDNAGKPDAELHQDLFREFKWSDGAGTLVPIAFPGLFPDLTRYQAEADQQQVNQGHQPWKLDAAMTATALGANLLKWSPNAPATIVNGGGKKDIDAVVEVKGSAPNAMIRVTMSRLEGNKNDGIWIVTSVTSPSLSIDSPKVNDRLTSPVTVQGKGTAFEAVIGTVTILDHTYTDIGHASARGATGMGNTTFSTNVSYTSTFKTGAQEGIVALYAPSNADNSIAGAVLVKVLLS